jgi:UDP-N-acetylmuramoyl-L-alanyl-D-glutamate--2,6-diaminopimelate ligase
MGTQAVPLSSLGLTAKGGGNPPIAGISVDSRQVQPGTLFAAMPGSKVHGAEFIQFAHGRGGGVDRRRGGHAGR